MKTPIYHPRFQSDLHEALDYYEQAGGSKLADRFFNEVEIHIRKISSNPERFPHDPSSLSRCNLKRFPYHILFYESSQQIAFQVIKHHRRHPSYGLRRNF